MVDCSPVVQWVIGSINTGGFIDPFSRSSYNIAILCIFSRMEHIKKKYLVANWKEKAMDK